MALSTNKAKRENAIEKRLASIGYRFIELRANKQSSGPTRYGIQFEAPTMERFDLLNGYQPYHTLYLDGVEALDEATGNPTILAWLCATVRRRKYEKPLMAVHTDSGWHTSAGEMLDRAQDSFGRSATRQFMAARGFIATSMSQDQIEADYARSEKELVKAMAECSKRGALLDSIAPSPENLDYEIYSRFERMLQRY